MKPNSPLTGEKILVLDDEPHVLDLIKLRLESQGYDVTPVREGEEALEKAKEMVLDLAIIDLKLSHGKDGMAVMDEFLLINPHLPVIILTAHGSIATAVDAMKRGAYSYLTKPYKAEELQLHIRKALEKKQLIKEITNLKAILEERFQEKNIIGQSNKMKEVFRQIESIAQTDATITLYGESGTGKELIAKTIHVKSHRRKGPFVAVNCGALPEGLLENELFGHIKGAYTDAREAKDGLFAQADKGTILLDEIGETNPAFQVKLLRVLQEKELRPLGGGAPQKIDVRVIAASNKNLQKAVENGEFREDLFYRIYVVPIHLPSLRERREDIPFLADHFLKESTQELGKDIKGFTPTAMQKMMVYHWPGNIRELKHTIERAVLLSTHDLIDEPDLIHLFPSLGAQTDVDKGSFQITYKKAKREFEKSYLSQLLYQVRGNVTEAAKVAKQHRGDLYRLMKKYDLKSTDYK